jgi:hypothetical protein
MCLWPSRRHRPDGVGRRPGRRHRLTMLPRCAGAIFRAHMQCSVPTVVGVPTMSIMLCRQSLLCRRSPLAQQSMCRRLTCANGLFGNLPRTYDVPTVPINCRWHRNWLSAPCGFPVVRVRAHAGVAVRRPVRCGKSCSHLD